MTLIAINVAVFVFVLLVTREPAALSGGVTDVHLRFGLSKDVLVQPIAWQSDDGGIYITEPDGWYRLVTSGFLHFGIIHLAFNMYFLYVLGPMLEPALGRVNYLLLYMASLLGGSLGVVVFDSGGITAGASGAVFGLLAAATVGLWRRGVNPFTTGIGATLDPQPVHHLRHPGHLDRRPHRWRGRRRDLRRRHAGALLPSRAGVDRLGDTGRRRASPAWWPSS